MLISRLDPFAKSSTSRLAARSYPKLYASDHGLAVAFSGLTDPLSDPSVRGRAFETVVFRHLRESALEGSSVSYVRDADGRSEVDFVLHEGARVQIALEVTSARDPSKKLERLRSAGARLKANRSIVVHGGIEQRRDGNLWAIPASSFLLAPAEWIGGR
jgi:predicted AAA+ superfamily ATPase